MRHDAVESHGTGTRIGVSSDNVPSNSAFGDVIQCRKRAGIYIRIQVDAVGANGKSNTLRDRSHCRNQNQRIELRYLTTATIGCIGVSPLDIIRSI